MSTSSYRIIGHHHVSLDIQKILQIPGRDRYCKPLFISRANPEMFGGSFHRSSHGMTGCLSNHLSSCTLPLNQMNLQMSHEKKKLMVG